MDKIKVNNQIVLMRKYVKQAKVRVINKLTKQVKLLQDRKGSEVQVAKAKRKAERFLEEIAVMKKIKPDYISKLALSKANDWNDVLMQKTSTLNDRCIALLASYKAVQDEVEKFYSSNPNIVPKIPDLVKEWEQKSKLMKGLPKGKKTPDIKKRRLEKIMKKEHSKDKMNSASFTLDKQMNDKNDVLAEIQKNLSNDEIDVSEEEKEAYSEETQETQNTPSLINKQEQKKWENIDKRRAQRQNLIESQDGISDIESSGSKESGENLAEESDESCSDDDSLPKHSLKKLVHNFEGKEREQRIKFVQSQNKISDIEPTENKEFDKNSVEEESEESCSDDEGSLKLPLERLAHNFKGNKSADSESMCDETSNIKDERNQTKPGKKKSPVKNVNSDSYKKENNKRRKLSNDFNSDISTVKSDRIQSPGMRLNHKKSSGKNLKAVAFINLNELEDLDEIPLDKTVDEESEESDDERKEPSEKEIDDPFFLSSRELDNANNIRNNSNMPYSRNARSFQNNFKEAGHSSFSRNEPSNFNYDRNKPFKRDNFQSKYNQHQFQSTGKYGFRRNEIHSSNRRERRNQMFGRSKKPQERNSNKLYLRNESNESFRKDKEATSKKGYDSNGKQLHPSWEAKKKLKEMAQTGFQGKRMVFNE